MPSIADLPDRRDILAAALASAAAGWPCQSLAAGPGASPPLGKPEPFSFERLKQTARALAGRPYAPPPKPAPGDPLAGMSYETFAQAVYKPQMELWRGVAGAEQVRLFPQGRFYAEPVAIHVLEGGQAREVLYSPDVFDMPANHPLRKQKSAGFAGFRLMSRGGESDWLAYLGASYFRASDPNDQYGASARGLAIDTGTPEEFPRFSSFWLQQNGPGQGMTIYALLESHSVTGAYRMDSRRLDGGKAGAVQEIECQLYFRAPVGLLGIAPLTGMYWYGENSGAVRGDWRPEVHDCDGLALWTGAGERLWRPLFDPPRLLTNSFADDDPKGFGLIQRDRDFEHYQDDHLFYEKRPSVWVEPLPSLSGPNASGWGKGAVNLVQLPTLGETEDNMVAFWTPRAPVVAGSVIDARYRLHWGVDAPPAGDVGRIISTRVGLGGLGGQDLDLRHTAPGARKFVIDIEGKAVAGAPAGGAKPVVTASRGRITNLDATPVMKTGRWRIMFDLSGLDGQPADLRAFLQKNGQALSETWIYEAFP